jgi:plasmid stabilization system protein ParE
MRVIWTEEARADLGRLYVFLAANNPRAADLAMQSLTEAPARLLMQPGIGQRIEAISDRTVRRIVVGRYELRYEITGEEIRISRIFHTREDR